MKTRIGITFALVVGALLLIGTVFVRLQQAQTPAQPPPHRSPPNMPNAPNAANAPNPPNPDPLADVMFPPDLIMSRARQLGLTDEQKAFMRGEIQRTMTSFNELQWKLQDEMEVFHETLKSSQVNEQQALAELNKVLDIEREIKRLHIGMGVRIKNHLTPEQQGQLQRMRMPPGMGPGPDAPPPPIPQ